MKLKVLAGAKQGAEIPLKKSKFVIGRASECTLRAGSEAISRQHCAVLRREKGFTIRDLGSRNGTFVNGKRIESETELTDGDQVRVGPLEFVFVGSNEPADSSSAGKTPSEGAREKKPRVKDVADALERTAEKSDSATIEEDDISNWLLGPDTGSKALNETQTFRMDDTHAIAQVTDASEPIPGEEASAAEEQEEEESKKKQGKPTPGKLPKLPAKPDAENSSAAAADILRELARRR